jgi:hypothetical protein
VERLKNEVKEGRKRESEGKKEVARLEQRYEEVWNDKVMLAETISVSTLPIWERRQRLIRSSQGPASMPLEILLTIAEFVAGSNNNRTLLNFSLMSKLIREEVKPVLYETMWYADGRGLVADAKKRHSDTAKYTK